MKKFEIGDVVRLKTDSPERLRLIVRSIDSDRLECTSECERRRVISHCDGFKLVERPDPQADMKQAIREVLLSDEFMTMFAAAFLSASVPRLTLEDLIPGVNRPMRNEAQISKMVEMVRQSLTNESNSPEIPDSSSDPMREAIDIIEVTSSPPKRYRKPTEDDLKNGPIACEYRDSDKEHWLSGFLVNILNGAIPFLCVNEEQDLSEQWDQCRIEVTDDPA